ncbi:MAG: SDR family oxidoreductase [Myxococcales bacterium]|nr:SDR family oxidoreductase [Myxococcales bacterium]MCB9647382.1 SDR family oxidoreductase [Deltaproteobacteria bacterium]
MMKLDLTGKNAFVTGVADDGGFGWAIAKSLQAAGANVYLASHPRVLGIVKRILERDKNAESRKLPYGAEGELAPKALIGCDVEFDTAEDIPAERREVKGYREEDVSIAGAFAKYAELSGNAPLDILIHAVAFSPEIQKSHLETSRAAYLLAHSVSSYSLIAMTRAALPYMADRDASVVGLSYLAANRVTPGYGGGMAAAKASLECDSRTLAWFVGEKGVRVNLISAGPFPSRAARSIGDMDEMVSATAAQSPLRRPISAEDVADATLFLCSDLSRNITGEVLYVDAGFHAMSPAF